MTQENFEKAKELQEQIAKLTEEINGSYLPDGFIQLFPYQCQKLRTV